MYSFHVTLLRLWGAKKTVDLCKSKAWKSWVEIADEGRYFSIDPLFDARGQNLILVLGLILLSPPQNLTGLPYSSISGLEGTQRHWVSDKVSSESLFSLYKDNFLGSPPRFKTGHIQIAQCNTHKTARGLISRLLAAADLCWHIYWHTSESGPFWSWRQMMNEIFEWWSSTDCY